MDRKLYGSANNVSELITDLYGSDNSQAQKVNKVYGSTLENSYTVASFTSPITNFDIDTFRLKLRDTYPAISKPARLDIYLDALSRWHITVYPTTGVGWGMFTAASWADAILDAAQWGITLDSTEPLDTSNRTIATFEDAQVWESKLVHQGFGHYDYGSIIIRAQTAGTMKVNNKWMTPILVENITQGTSAVTVAKSSGTNVAVNAGDEVKVSESSANTTFRDWASFNAAFVSGVPSAIVYIPSMDKFTTDLAGTTAGTSFFGYFNYKGQLTSLPAGSFDTSKITNTGSSFFAYFNSNGQLNSLPAGSFDTSNITTAGNSFFSYFNYNGSLVSLPTGAFNISNITNVGNSFFYGFNLKGQLVSLPTGSFDTSNITSTGTGFFHAFNSGGQIVSLPAGSFDTSNIATIGNNFFNSFNSEGKLTSLPIGSFDISNITSAGSFFFYQFNYKGQLTSLPASSFDTSAITSVGGSFFEGFNREGKIASLPSGSFNTSNITSTGSRFFVYFNIDGYIPKDTVDYNINFVNSSSSTVSAYYWNGSSSVTENVGANGQFYYYQA